MTDSETIEPLLSIRFHSALSLASELHAHQPRKGGSIPYVSHLLSVCSIILRAGGNEDQAITGLLHDALEDQGKKISRVDIADRFGEKISQMVLDCTDETEEDRSKTPWKERKIKYLNHLSKISDDTRLVIIADKLDNIRDMKREYKVLGDRLWEKFTGKKEGVAWFHGEMTRTLVRWKENFRDRNCESVVTLIDEFEEICSELH